MEEQRRSATYVALLVIFSLLFVGVMAALFGGPIPDQPEPPAAQPKIAVPAAGP